MSFAPAERKCWAATIAANPNMSLDEWRDLIEHWAEVTAEPGGVDYLDAFHYYESTHPFGKVVISQKRW